MTTNKKHNCGWCSSARSVMAGTRYGLQQNGRTQWLTQQEAIDYLMGKCTKGKKGWEPNTVKEIRREGQRILKAGANVYVQPKRKKGTKKYEGSVIGCYDNGTVKILVPMLGTAITVQADEFVKGRKGTTKGRN